MTSSQTLVKPQKRFSFLVWPLGPLAADVEFQLRGKEKEIQAAITALGNLPLETYMSVWLIKELLSLVKIEGAKLHTVSGPHPAGLVGTQINKIDPINKGEVVWTIAPQDLVIIGQALLEGKFVAERTVALAGSSLESPQYVTATVGTELSGLVAVGAPKEEKARIINGDVLTGTQAQAAEGLGFYNSTVTVIPEGDDYDFFGWNRPIFDKISTSRALTFSWLMPKRSMH